MSLLTTSTSTCVLDKLEDWQNWFLIVKNKAEGAGIWKYIDPSVTNPPAPPEQPTYPAVSEVKATAGTFYNLSAEEKQQYIVLQNFFKGEISAYN